MERPKIYKRKITNDWQKYCPELSKLRMLDIDNRVGPLVIGFYLQIIGDGTIYMPLYKVGNLYSHIYRFYRNRRTIDGYANA